MRDSYTVKELSEYWGVDEDVVYRLCKTSLELGAFKVGSKILIPHAGVKAYEFAKTTYVEPAEPRRKQRKRYGNPGYVYRPGDKLV